MTAADSLPPGSPSSAAPKVASGGRSWPYSLSLALAATLASPFLFGLFDGAEPITDFPDRAIGRVVLEGLDVSGYVHNYVVLWGSLLAVFLLAGLALVRLRDALVRGAGETGLGAEFRGLARLSELAVALVVLRLWTGDERVLALKGLLDRALVLLLVFTVAKVLALRRPTTSRDLKSLLADTDFLVLLLFLPAPFVFAAHLLLRRPLYFGDLDLAAWLACSALLFLAVVLLLRRTAGDVPPDDPARRVTATQRALAVVAAPGVLFPLAFPVGNELQSFARAYSPRLLVGLAGLLLAAVGVGLAVWLHRRWRRSGGAAPLPSVRAMLAYFYFPTLVVTVTDFASHTQVWNVGDLDYFHHGEKVLPVQQLFQFGLLPQVDLRLTHSFSDMLYGTLYALFSGDYGVDTLVWNRWLPGVFAMLVLYFFLARVLGPVFSLLVCCLLPVTNLAPSYYAPALVPALFLAFAVARPSWRRWLLVWVSALGVFLWRIDFGLAAAVSLALALATFLLWEPRRRWRQVAASLAIFAGGTLALLASAALLLRLPLFDTLSRLFTSYASRLVTRTRSEVIDAFTMAAALQYYVLPAVAALHLAYLAVARGVRRLRLAPQHFQLLYLAAFCLVISLRSLERHSLVESFNPYGFVLLLALAPALPWRAGRPREDAVARVTFLGVVVATVLFVLPPASFGSGAYVALGLTGERPLYRLRHWQPGERRVRFDDSRHRPLVELMDASLEDGQTFYDFTNSPLLYAFAGREFPTWIVPNLVQTSDSVQRQVIADLRRLLDAGRLPLVVFEQGSAFWDNADGVPNEIRSYRVAEFIYRHYRPWVRVGDYQLWWHKDGPAPSDGLPSEGLELGLGRQAVSHDLQVLPSGEGWLVEAGEDDPYIHRFADLAALPDLDRIRLRWLRLRYVSSRKGTLEVRFGTDGRYFNARQMASVEVEQTGDEPALAFVPLAPAGAAGRWTDLRLDPPPGSTFGLLAAEVVPLPVERLDTPAQIEQWYQLEWLPRVWADLDPLQARTRTRVERTLHSSRRELAAGEELSWPVEPGFDRTQGNYLHLRLRPELMARPRSRPQGRVEVRYGPRLADGFAFRLAEGDRVVLAKSGGAVLHDVTTFPLGGRTIYETTGARPQVSGVLALDQVPAAAERDAEYLLLRYRARGGGPMRVDFLYEGDRSGEAPSRHEALFSTETAGPELPRPLWLPLPDRGTSGRLADLRFHLPPDTLFELVDAALVTAPSRDYLIRVSTQWKWWAQPPQRITVRSNVPVVVERAWIRSGD